MDIHNPQNLRALPCKGTCPAGDVIHHAHPGYNKAIENALERVADSDLTPELKKRKIADMMEEIDRQITDGTQIVNEGGTAATTAKWDKIFKDAGV